MHADIVPRSLRLLVSTGVTRALIGGGGGRVVYLYIRVLPDEF